MYVYLYAYVMLEIVFCYVSNRLRYCIRIDMTGVVQTVLVVAWHSEGSGLEFSQRQSMSLRSGPPLVVSRLFAKIAFIVGSPIKNL